MRNVIKRPVLTSNGCPHFAVWLTLVYFYFMNLFANYWDSGFVGRVYAVSVFAIIILYTLLNRRLPQIHIHVPLLLFLVIMLFASKKAIQDNNLYWVTMYLMLTGLVFVLSGTSNWLEKLWPTMITLGMIHVVATILFYICNPWLYNAVMLPIWGDIPGGCTAADTYKAGLSNHYSANGIYCCAVCLALGASVIVKPKNKKRKKEIVMLIMAVFALLLTTKRGPLLFIFLALIVTYYICNPTIGVNKSFYIMLFGVIALILFYMLAPILPVFGNILNRFTEAEDISSNRFTFWEIAYQLFLTNKIWGIGWGEFISMSRTGTSVHNIYIQLLCETGIVGLAVFLLAAIGIYRTAIKDYRKHSQTMKDWQKYSLAGAIAVQTFIIAYGFTGNCLYDMTVFVYYLSLAASLSVHYALNPRKNKSQRAV